MQSEFDPSLNAHLRRDDAGRLRAIRHEQGLWSSGKANAVETAIDYVRAMGTRLAIDGRQLESLHQRLSYVEPAERGIEYRKAQEKTLFDSTTVEFAQTYLNVPVWRAGCVVTVKHDPPRVVSLTDSSQSGIDARLPPPGKIAQYRERFAHAEAERATRGAGLAPPGEAPATAAFVRGLVDRSKASKDAAPPPGEKEGGDDCRLIRGRFYVYRYRAAERLPKPSSEAPTMPLGPVPASVGDGAWRVVAELTFSYATQAYGRLHWLALVDVETDAVLHLRALVASVQGQVFLLDPVSKSGKADLTADKPGSDLDLFRDSVPLPNLDAPVGTDQLLSGAYAALKEIEPIQDDAPKLSAGAAFDFAARTNAFAAVNAYYHVDRFFRLMQDLGFDLASYFESTPFPIPVDHRGAPHKTTGAVVVNAHCAGSGTGGIEHLCYSVADLTDLANPMGIAADWRVHLHELAGHGVIFEHLESADGQFEFAHSAGDSVAAILTDPDSQAPDRFRTFPFIPTITRRHDRPVSEGWAWGGVKDIPTHVDNYGYSSEQILTTTLFRAYRSIGGDSPDLSRRRFASRMMTYLILRAIGTLTPSSDTWEPNSFADALQAVDKLDWTTEGVHGGAYGKVLRWAFEKQGLYQPQGTPKPITTQGAPPAVDVYIDDGRGGEYPFLFAHWNNPSIWNRHAPDGGAQHQEPVAGQPNYAYAKVKNRGTQAANNLAVKGYHSLPGAGLQWPTDFQPMAPLAVPLPTVPAPLPGNNAEERVVGPFVWVPTTNAFGHDCMLMIASADQDPSNADSFTASKPIAEWRLVPHDNNVAQRNLVPVPGGGGPANLTDALDERFFLVGNPNPRPATIRLETNLPRVLADRGWRMAFADEEREIRLGPGEKRKVRLALHPGRPFTPRDVAEGEERDIHVRAFADGVLLGGMTYRLDPEMTVSANRRGGPPEHAQKGKKRPDERRDR